MEKEIISKEDQQIQKLGESINELIDSDGRGLSYAVLIGIVEMVKQGLYEETRDDNDYWN